MRGFRFSTGTTAARAWPDPGELVVVDGEGALLVGVDGESRRIQSDRGRLPGAPGPHVLVDDEGQTLALTP
jgi:hypothetical protein